MSRLFAATQSARNQRAGTRRRRTSGGATVACLHRAIGQFREKRKIRGTLVGIYGSEIGLTLKPKSGIVRLEHYFFPHCARKSGSLEHLTRAKDGQALTASHILNIKLWNWHGAALHRLGSFSLILCGFSEGFFFLPALHCIRTNEREETETDLTVILAYLPPAYLHTPPSLFFKLI